LIGDYEAMPIEGVRLSDYVNVVRRRKWLILTVALLVLFVGLVVSMRQKSAYSASARVIEPPASSAPGSAAALVQRSTEAEASLARSPAIAVDVIRATDADISTEEFLAQSSVEAAEDSDVLVFTVRAGDAAEAVRLVNAYAREFAAYRGDLAAAVFEQALSRIEGSLEDIEQRLALAQSEGGDAQSLRTDLLRQRYQELLDEQQRLLSTQALVSTSVVSIPAERALRVGSHPMRNTLLALVLGLVLGTIVAFLREAADPRVRSIEEIGERLGLPLLARVPSPPRYLGWQEKLIMLESPSAPGAESFRILRTNLDFANLPFGVRTVMLTSALAGEGRTTTLANLGVAIARSGRSVILVDLDLRRPGLGSLFALGDGPGVADVAVRRADLDDALAHIVLADYEGRGAEEQASEEWRELEGVLEVLPAGSAPPEPGDLVGTPALAEILRELSERSDLVIIDSPPLLTVADGVALSAKVDAIVAVVRADARRHATDEFRRVLDLCPAPKLGYVVTAVAVETAYAPGSSASRTLTGESQARSTQRVSDRP
jgi:succinoglycan biosynthesis transport protein ExoP